jgi:hypothetical protein
MISTKALIELDDIVDDYWKKFESKRMKLLRSEANEYMKLYAHLLPEHARAVNLQIKQYQDRSRYTRKEKYLSIIIDEDYERRAVFCESFERALRNRDLLNKRPAGFKIDMLSGDIKVTIAADDVIDGIVVSYEPIDEPIAQELYTAVSDWASEIRQHSLLEGIWGKVAKYKLWIWSFYTLFIFLFFIGTRMTTSAVTRERLLALYDQGISGTNVVEAVRLLALLQRDEQLIPLVASPWLGTSLVFLLYLFIVLIFRPRVELEIGRGRNAKFRWRVYKWFMLFLPVFLFRDVFLSYLAELAKSFYFLSP